MNTQRILVADDDRAILKVVDYALAQEGYEVHTTEDGAAVEGMLAEVTPALVILDVMLPGKSGLDIARDIRVHSNVPIIMLSARAEEVDRILGLEFGADDYVTKPFSPRELVSRVKGLIRRASTGCDDATSIHIGGLEIDVLSRQVTVSGVAVPLTRTEFDILLHLARHAGTAFSRDAILGSLSDPTSGDERAIDVHIHNLREKLEPDPKDPMYILTVRGYGYRLRGV